jgi:transposase
MLTDSHGSSVWTWRPLRVANRGKEIRELVLAGTSVRSIAEELSLPATTVYRAIQRMREQGELPEEAGRNQGVS